MAFTIQQHNSGSTQERAHAVVIGGSIAGLFAARVLSDHFNLVSIVDRDRFPDQPVPRKGVPQAHHIHVVLARGQRVFEQLLPGLGGELTAAGAITLEWGYDSLIFTLGVWMPKTRTGLFTHICSRDLLEFTIRRRVSGLGNVRFLEERDVIGLQTDESRARVTGVRTRSRRRAITLPEGEDLRADLVVDASGRASRASEWLQELGYPAPVETTVNSYLGYASRVYEQPSNFSADWKFLVLRGQPPHIVRGGVLYPIEGGRWLVTLAGAGRDYPPLDDAGFLNFAQTLGEVPLLYEVIRDARPLTNPNGYQRTDNRWRHYERLTRWPENFVILGDAVCAFNPLYGQGMTVAALDALTLDECLHYSTRRNDPGGIAQRYQRAMSKNLSTPWLMATGEDFRVPQTEGAHPGRTLRAMHAYMDKLIYVCSRSPKVFQTYTEVAHLIRPLYVLFRPDIVMRVLSLY